jgi:hypothetical protein
VHLVPCSWDVPRIPNGGVFPSGSPDLVADGDVGDVRRELTRALTEASSCEKESGSLLS